MPMFICARCLTVDNTARGDYWPAIAAGRAPVCTACRRGKWHDAYPRECYDETKHGHMDGQTRIIVRWRPAEARDDTPRKDWQ